MHRFNLPVASVAGGLALLGATLSSAAADLPEGPGRDLVEGFCTGCHNTNLITRGSGYSQEEWKAPMVTMIDLPGVPEDEEDISVYLAQHFTLHNGRACPATSRPRSRNGSCRNSVSVRAIPPKRRTARSGGPVSTVT